MEKIINLNMMNELPDVFYKNAREASEYVCLISEELSNRYYFVGLKKHIGKIMERFNDAKFVLGSKLDNGLKSSTMSEVRIINRSFMPHDFTGDIVESFVDYEIWTKDMYDHLISLSKRITYEEAVYFVETFIKHSSEELISEKLNMCRVSLQKIKKSILIKAYLEFCF